MRREPARWDGFRTASLTLPAPSRLTAVDRDRARYCFGSVVRVQLSVRNGDAGRPALFQRFTTG